MPVNEVKPISKKEMGESLRHLINVANHHAERVEQVKLMPSGFKRNMIIDVSIHELRINAAKSPSMATVIFNFIEWRLKYGR